MRKNRAALVSVGALVASSALVAAASVPSGAVSPYIVKVGTLTSGAVPVTAVTIGATPQVVFTDVTSNQTLTCDSGSGTGNVNTGTNATGKNLATITSIAFSNCIGPAGLRLTIVQSGTIGLNATKPVAANGVVQGNVAGIKAHVSASSASQCSFDAAGGGTGSFSNSAQTITSPGKSATITISNVVGCFGLIRNGDKSSLKGVIKVTSKVGKISIANG